MNQFTAIYNGSGELINQIKYYDGFMGQRVGAISCLAFHPHWVCVSAPVKGWGFGRHGEVLAAASRGPRPSPQSATPGSPGAIAPRPLPLEAASNSLSLRADMK